MNSPNSKPRKFNYYLKAQCEKENQKKLDFNTNFKPGDYLQFSIQGRVGGAKEHEIGNDHITVLFR